MLEVALLVLAAGFAFVNGMNDGGSITSTGIKLPGLAPLTAIAMLTLALMAVPLVIGTAVATTLASRLVTFDGGEAGPTVTVAVLVAVGLVLALSRWGLPTSLTLAVVGAITGAGLGAGLPVAWGWVAWVLAIAAAAPLVGALLALAVTWLLYRLNPRVSAHTSLRHGHWVSFSLQCLAYGLNDGQKILAVFALALALPTAPVELPIGTLLLIGASFAVGAAVGLRRYGGMLGDGVMMVRPINAAVAEFAAGVSVIVTGLLGAPVSMTQAVAGGLIGSGAHESTRRIRWNRALMIVLAWVVTLPVALVAATGISALVGRATTMLAAG